MKTVQLEDADHALLKEIASLHRRSMPQELGVMIEDAADHIAVGKAIAEGMRSYPTSFDSKPKDLDKITEPYKELFDTAEPKPKKSTASAPKLHKQAVVGPKKFNPITKKFESKGKSK